MEGLFDVIALGARDYYQVALGLHKRNMLGKILTDWYCPDFCRKTLKKHFHPSIEAKFSGSLIFIGILSYFARWHRLVLVRHHVDWLFGFACAVRNLRSGNSVVVYSYYLEGFVACCRMLRRRPPRLVCFQVHPTPWFVKEVLDEDSEKSHRLLGVEFHKDMETAYGPSQVANYKSALEFCDGFIFASSISRLSIVPSSAIDRPFVIAPYGSKFEDSRLSTQDIGEKSLFKTQKIRLLSVCQVTQRKGLHWIFKWMNEYSRYREFEWVVVARKIDPKILKLAPDNVKFVSEVSDETLEATIRSAHVFVMPSLIEGFGLVYVEALSAGLPVIYGKMTGVTDLLEGEEVGVELVASDRPAAFRLFDKLLQDGVAIQRMSQASRIVARRASWEHFRSVTTNFLQSV